MATRATSSRTGTARSRGARPCGAELQWLKADLAAHAGALKFAFFHYPLHSDSSSQSSDTFLTGPNGLEGLLANNGVGIVFNGHAHHYERNFPQIPGKPLVSYVTGGGGDALGSVSTCSAFDAYAIGSNSSCQAPKPASAANVYHFLLVTVNGNQVTVTPTDSTGRTFDVQTYTFSGSGGGGDTSAPSAPGNLTAVAASPTQVNLGWTASTDNVGVTGYTITRNGVHADDGRRDDDDVHRRDGGAEHVVHLFGARDRCRGQRLAAVELGDGDDAGRRRHVHVHADG